MLRRAGQACRTMMAMGLPCWREMTPLRIKHERGRVVLVKVQVAAPHEGPKHGTASWHQRCRCYTRATNTHYCMHQLAPDRRGALLPCGSSPSARACLPGRSCSPSPTPPGGQSMRRQQENHSLRGPYGRFGIWVRPGSMKGMTAHDSASTSEIHAIHASLLHSPCPAVLSGTRTSGAAACA